MAKFSSQWQNFLSHCKTFFLTAISSVLVATFPFTIKFTTSQSGRVIYEEDNSDDFVGSYFFKCNVLCNSQSVGQNSTRKYTCHSTKNCPFLSRSVFSAL